MNSEIEYFIKNISSFSKKNCSSNSPYNFQVERGQSAKTLVISCADSLVDPMILMGASVGQIFSHRNISGLVYPHDPKNTSPIATAAVLEYAIKNLDINDIVILGHGCCGGVLAAITNAEELKKTEYLADWLKILQPKIKEILEKNKNLTFEEKRTLCEKETILISFQNLETFPFIKKKLQEESLNIHAWHFDRGVLSIYDNQGWQKISNNK
jgi:carbonic anhydrase